MKAVLLYYEIVNPMVVVVDNIESRNSHTLAFILEIIKVDIKCHVSVAIKFGIYVMTENIDVKIA